MPFNRSYAPCRSYTDYIYIMMKHHAQLICIKQERKGGKEAAKRFEKPKETAKAANAGRRCASVGGRQFCGDRADTERAPVYDRHRRRLTTGFPQRVLVLSVRGVRSERSERRRPGAQTAVEDSGSNRAAAAPRGYADSIYVVSSN